MYNVKNECEAHHDFTSSLSCWYRLVPPTSMCRAAFPRACSEFAYFGRKPRARGASCCCRGHSQVIVSCVSSVFAWCACNVQNLPFTRQESRRFAKTILANVGRAQTFVPRVLTATEHRRPWWWFSRSFHYKIRRSKSTAQCRSRTSLCPNSPHGISFPPGEGGTGSGAQTCRPSCDVIPARWGEGLIIRPTNSRA